MGWFEAVSHVILCLLPSQATYKVAIIIGTPEKSMYMYMYVITLAGSMSASGVIFLATETSGGVYVC